MPVDHVSRSPNDTYYVDPDTVLRCHTSAHQAEMLRRGLSAFLVTGVTIFHISIKTRDSAERTSSPCTRSPRMQGLHATRSCACDRFARNDRNFHA